MARPTGRIAELLATLPTDAQNFWSGRVVTAQRNVMIAAAATAVGINMTFLMPYSMLRRGWDRNFRGLSRFDLSTGMAIPYVLVTSCVVIASATQFHAQVDEAFLSDNPADMQESPLFAGTCLKALVDRVEAEADITGILKDEEIREALTPEELTKIATLNDAEKIVASASEETNRFRTVDRALSHLCWVTSTAQVCIRSRDLRHGLFHHHHPNADQRVRHLRNCQQAARW